MKFYGVTLTYIDQPPVIRYLWGEVERTKMEYVYKGYTRNAIMWACAVDTAIAVTHIIVKQLCSIHVTNNQGNELLPGASQITIAGGSFNLP